MFDKEYSFKGSHAEKVSKLTAKFDETTSLFERNFDVYMMAPIVGFLYGRKADLDKNSNETTKIFPDILMREKDNLMFNYRLIMLLDGCDSIRDVMAFPKVQNACELMSGAPGIVDDKQLVELAININTTEE